MAVSNHEDELALIEAGINLMADDLEDRENEAKEYENKLREERNRIARELHDSVSQLLFGAVLNSEVARSLVESDPEGAKARIETAQVSASEAQQQMRELLTELRLGPLSKGLTAALDTFVTAFSERDGIEASFSVDGERQLAPNIERELFRIAQEAMNNVAKHSQATSAAVKLAFSPELVRVSVEDNGVGFDPSRPKSGETGLGLTHMREGTEGLGGRLTVGSAPGKGTKIMVEVPLEESDVA
jgi:signal transduction histidine kinase